MRSAALLGVLALAILAPMVQAQTLVASVDLQCEERAEIEVAPWSTPVASYVCTVANESVYQEKIDITVYSDGLAVAHPGSITLNAGTEETFTVSVQADTGAKAQSRQNTVEVQVVEINGVPPPNIASADTTVIVDILQYGQAEVEGEMTVFRAMKGLTIVEAEALITNSGNDVDDVCVTFDVRSWTWEGGESATIETGESCVQVKPGNSDAARAQVSIPDDVGRRGDERIVLDVTAWSRYACDVVMEGCQQEQATSSITIAPPDDEDIIPENNDSLVEESPLPAPGALVPMVAMVLAATITRRREEVMSDADAD